MSNKMVKKYNSCDVDICGYCSGEGAQFKAGTRGHGSHDDSSWVKCTVCDGVGMVKVRKVVTVTVEPHRVRVLED